MTPAPILEVQGQSYYDRSDPTRSLVVPEKQARDTERRAELNRFLDEMSRLSDRAALAQDPAAIACAEGDLKRWAQAGALLKAAPGDNKPRLVQQWALSTLSLVVIKLHAGTSINVDAATAQWLRSIAAEVQAFHEGRPARRRNNLFYWAALALASTAEAIRDDRLWESAEAMYRTALEDIDDRGLLPRELGRGVRAAKYHAFAAQPLAILDALGRSTGRFRETDPRLLRLIELIEQPAAATRQIEAITGKTQEPLGPQAWIAAWRGDRCDTHFIQRLGGRMSALSNTLARNRGQPARCTAGSGR